MVLDSSPESVLVVGGGGVVVGVSVGVSVGVIVGGASKQLSRSSCLGVRCPLNFSGKINRVC